MFLSNATFYDLTPVKEGGVKISSAKMLEELWLQEKYDLLLVKLFDRLHNMKTINSKKKSKIQKNIEESLKNFLTFAEFLEMPEISDLISSLGTVKLINIEVCDSMIFS
jgi:(p)ppGpp synthase/HD superfamily hydrolase